MTESVVAVIVAQVLAANIHLRFGRAKSRNGDDGRDGGRSQMRRPGARPSQFTDSALFDDFDIDVDPRLEMRDEQGRPGGGGGGGDDGGSGGRTPTSPGSSAGGGMRERQRGVSTVQTRNDRLEREAKMLRKHVRVLSRKLETLRKTYKRDGPFSPYFGMTRDAIGAEQSSIHAQLRVENDDLAREIAERDRKIQKLQGMLNSPALSNAGGAGGDRGGGGGGGGGGGVSTPGVAAGGGAGQTYGTL